MRTNLKTQPVQTHEGALAARQSPINELKRTAMACLLWENSFYESGVSVADRIKALVPKCKPFEVADLAIKARDEQHLRHLPLLLVRELARNSSRAPDGLIAETLSQVIQRPDELTEFLSIYWMEGKQPLSKQVKKGLARAFRKFNEYQLAKYNRDNAIKLRDVLFMVHAKPVDEKQADLWKRLCDGTLQTPDTWEVALSGGADKRETFERLLSEGKLGYMALLRNLRNMHQSGVSLSAVKARLLEGAVSSKALPYRFIAAARAVPAWEPAIDEAMQLALVEQKTMAGKTAVLVDVSGSMDDKISAKSDLTRLDAACALAILLRGICEEVRVFTFSRAVVEVPPRQGMALADAIVRSQPHAATYLGQAVDAINREVEYSRLIVFTDEQSHDRVPNPKGKAYLVNVATNQYGVNHGAWEQVNGFSESIVQYIMELESEK